MRSPSPLAIPDTSHINGSRHTSASCVSICLPTLNRRAYLNARLESILEQTHTNWELLVVDSHSDDGTYEQLRSLADIDPRVKVVQAPRDGIYPNINRCIQLARGDYVYIATSDDTMAPDCLEKLARALDEHPECDLAHCLLKVIDEDGYDLPDVQHWWSHRSLFARSSGELRERLHVRYAPFDGLLHLGGETVYNSLTELLIRRSLFSRIGMFESRWGSIGDFNWDMRAGLVANTVHIPDTWGSWRLHGTQATAGVDLLSSQYAGQIEEMIEHALCSSEPELSRSVLPVLTNRWCNRARDLRVFLRGHRLRRGWFSRQTFLLRRLLAGSVAARYYLKDRFSRRNNCSSFATLALMDWFSAAGRVHLAKSA